MGGQEYMLEENAPCGVATAFTKNTTKYYIFDLQISPFVHLETEGEFSALDSEQWDAEHALLWTITFH